MAQVHDKDQISEENRLVKQTFVSKYLLCCFSHKYRYPKSYIRKSSSAIKTRQKVQVPKLQPKAVKVFDVNDQNTEIKALNFKQIKMPSIPESGARMVRSQMYAMEDNKMTVPQKIEQTNLLDFRLDDEPGVSNTFAIPFFDYGGLMQNRYYSKSTINVIKVDQNA